MNAAEETEFEDTNTEPETTTDPSTEPTDPEVQEPSPDEVKRLELLDKAQEKIDSGEASYDEFPEWIQLRTTPKKSNDELKAEGKQEQKVDARYDSLHKTIPADISDEKLAELNKILEDEHENKGHPKDEALEFALFKTGISKENSEKKLIQKGIKIERESLIGIGDRKVDVKKKTKEQEAEARYNDPKSLPPMFRPIEK